MLRLRSRDWFASAEDAEDYVDSVIANHKRLYGQTEQSWVEVVFCSPSRHASFCDDASADIGLQFWEMAFQAMKADVLNSMKLKGWDLKEKKNEVGELGMSK